jgi:ubiquinone/menaquinone biosynthesis C-methylase UbiE
MKGTNIGGSRLMRMLTRGCFPHEFSWLIDNPVRRLFVAPEELADRLPILEGSRVLEIGPGSGYFSGEFALRVPGGRLELFDVQPEMLAKAKRKLDARGFLNVGYTPGDASAELPFPEDHFDLAVLVTVLGEVPDKAACIKSVHRVLRAQGVLAVHEHLPDPDFISFERLRSRVEGYGFVFQQQWGRWWNYTAIFQKSSTG